MKRLYRSRTNKALAGVCGGLGEYFEIDPVIIRLVAVCFMIFGGFPLLLYVIAIFVIPKAPLSAEAAVVSPTPEVKPHEPAPEEHEREKARMEEHVKILGILYIALHALGIIAAAIIFAIFFASGLIIVDEEVTFILKIIGIAVPAILVLFSLPGIFAGLGLLKKESWARILAMVLGFINLINLPFGTILGIYTIWVLSKKETQELFT